MNYLSIKLKKKNNKKKQQKKTTTRQVLNHYITQITQIPALVYPFILKLKAEGSTTTTKKLLKTEKISQPRKKIFLAQIKFSVRTFRVIKKSSYKNATENLRFSCTCNVLVSFCRSIKKRIFFTCLIWLFCANTFRLHHKVNCQIGGVHVMTQRKSDLQRHLVGFFEISECLYSELSYYDELSC